MKISLTKVTFAEALSQETNAFSATVCIDGKPAFIASNDGQGGCDRHEPIDSNYSAMREKIELVQAYAKTLPIEKRKLGTHEYDHEPDLDSLVGDAFALWLKAKDVAKLLRKTKDRIVMIEGTTISTCYKGLAPVQIPEAIRRCQAKYPNAVILNALPREQAEAKLAEVMP